MIIITLNTVLILGLLSILTTVFLIYWSYAPVLLKLIILPLFLMFGIFAYVFYMNVLGSPIPHRPTGEVDYVYHKVINDHILLWGFNLKQGDRLWKWEYNRADAKVLYEAQNNDENNSGPTVLDFDDNSISENNITLQNDFSDRTDRPKKSDIEIDPYNE